jgi:DnaK suppressor protein
MDSATLRNYETILIELQTKLRAEIDQTGADSAPVSLDGSMGRLSRNDAMQAQQLALEMKRRRQQRILRVQTALERIKQGTYGLCGRCRDEIGAGRLDVSPDVVFCVDCASDSGG